MNLPVRTRDVLWRKGLLRETWPRGSRRVPCGTPGHDHPGYVAISGAGVRVLRRSAGSF